MANERNTEILVRNHFSKFTSDIIIDEQQSSHPIINKLLKNASKSGTGRGYPEFIIQYKQHSDFIIIVECKSDIKKHESENLDKYAEYAVDGVLLYAANLSKNFDVLAIAVSGENLSELNVSHYLLLKGEKSPNKIFGNKLLPSIDYLSGYLKSPEKFKQDYESLLDFTKKLNEKLHLNEINEQKRALLLSCILIALENLAFKNSYASHKTPQNLANTLVHTVSDELEDAGITGKKLSTLNSEFVFIRNDTSLAGKPKVLKELIDEIDFNINNFIKTHKYFDVLGQLYIEFLRYANSDKGLGIVLTPPHITEFFAEIAQVNKHSIVYDNCTGTGGFLISAMKKMIEDAKGNEKTIRSIKSNQLIGVEYQSYIFPLAVSNMFIHQDGKTNIFGGDCFDENITTEIKAKKPTVGLLNPPYKSDKKNDIDEFKFIINNLSCLVDGGTCVAIVPMQSALATKGKVYELKKLLLSEHTLEAVLSMPDELFFNSKVGVVSCIMIFTAHKPHPHHKETYFGYYKNDGFVKRKIQGRYDAFGAWNEIKEKWLTNFQNKKSEAGFSICKVVNAKQEWCAEGYMQTNYNQLQENHFINTLLNFATFLFGNKLTNQVSTKRYKQNSIKLDTQKWQYFSLQGELFEISGSKTTPILELEEYGAGIYPYVTTQATNNGVGGFFNYYTEHGKVLTIDSAVLGYCSYQANNFSASDHVEKLVPNFAMNKFIAMFFVTILNLETYRYNYGRKASQTRMKKIKIKLPEKNQKPDFHYMETYIKSLPYSSSI